MVKIDQERCTGCGLCVLDCVAEVLSIREGTAKVNAPCIQCGHCVAVCPSGAPSIPEYGMEDVEEARPTDRSGDGIFSAEAFVHTVKMRRSIRQYEARPIEREKLELLVQAGRYTATAVNHQDCRFIVVQKDLARLKDLIWEGIGKALTLPEAERPAGIERFARFYRRRREDPSFDFLFRNAPAVIFIAAQRELDAGLAAQNMELAAAAQGLGVLYNGYLARAAALIPQAAQWLAAGEKPIAACMLAGYPAVRYARSAPRRAADVLWK